MIKILLSAVLLVYTVSASATEISCDKEDIMSVCGSVSDSKSAMDCYKGAKGKYSGVHCEEKCKDTLLYCVDEEKVSLKNIFDN